MLKRVERHSCRRMLTAHESVWSDTREEAAYSTRLLDRLGCCRLLAAAAGAAAGAAAVAAVVVVVVVVDLRTLYSAIKDRRTFMSF